MIYLKMIFINISVWIYLSVILTTVHRESSRAGRVIVSSDISGGFRRVVHNYFPTREEEEGEGELD